MVFFKKYSNADFLNTFRNEFKQRFGVSVSFVATHSGLLRWLDHSISNDDIKPE